MKKLFALLLVAIMALSMVACGADKTATTEAPKTDAPAAPAATQAETTVSDEPCDHPLPALHGRGQQVRRP